MGGVKEDIHKKEYEFKNISFSDIETVKGLIVHRQYIDPYKDIYTNNHYNIAGEVYPINQELIALFADLDKLLKEVKLTGKQRYVIEKLMEGLELTDIAEEFNQESWKIDSVLETACKKIKELNDYKWKHENIYINYLKANWEFKRCSKCNKDKPKTNEFFSPDSTKNSGYKSICKYCRV